MRKVITGTKFRTLDYSVPTLPTLAGARAAVEAIEALQTLTIVIHALQDVHSSLADQ